MGEREDFVKNAAKKYSKGKFTASQTGARQFAERRKTGNDLKKVLDSVESQDSFEDMINGKKPRPTRTKR